MAKSEALVERTTQLSFDQLAQMAHNGADEVGSEYDLVDKAELIGVPFIIQDYKINSGDYKAADGSGSHFVSVQVVTQDGRKLVFNDGSTGVLAQIQDADVEWSNIIGQEGKGILISRGLRVSEYEYNGNPAKTYYLDAR